MGCIMHRNASIRTGGVDAYSSGGSGLSGSSVQNAERSAPSLALRQSGVTCNALARSLGVHEKIVRRMVNPRRETAAEQINAAMRVLGQFKPD